MSAVRLVLLLASAAGPAAAAGPGSTAAASLKLPQAARAAGLGQAFTGLADDPSALAWNPAGLSTLAAPELSLMHTDYLADTSHDVVAYAHPVSGIGTFAASVSSLDYGVLPRTAERADGLYGGVSGSTAPQDLAVQAGFGAALPRWFGLERLRGGATLKLAFQLLSGGTLVGAAGSLGALWDAPLEGLRVGTLVDNVGAVAGRGRLLPLAWTLGASYAAELAATFRAVYAADLKVQVDARPLASTGVELTAFEYVQLRAGVRGGGEAPGGPTWGAGVRYPLTWFGRTMLWKLDYATAGSGELGDARRFQLSVQFGGYSTAVRLGSARIDDEGAGPVLSWKGRGPAWHVFVRRPGDRQFVQLTDRPVEEPRLPLLGLPPGRYAFVIQAVNPWNPDWRGPVSPEIELDLRP
jgi:hypothetical protein